MTHFFNRGVVYSGIKFNNIMQGDNMKGTLLVKLTNESENHNNFQFRTGLNIDNIPFNPTRECTAGGLYFCEFQYLEQYIMYGNKICINMRYVTIPDDAQVYIEYL